MTSQSNPFLRSIAIPSRTGSKHVGRSTFCRPMSRLPPRPGLEREMRTRVDMDMVHRVADASRQGRSLLVNTSDIDNGGHWVWDVGSEAQRAAERGNCDRVHQILLASSG